MKLWLSFSLLFVLLSCKENPNSAAPPKTYQEAALPPKETANPYVPVDVSPMDMLYFPTDYAVKKMNGEAKGLPVLRIIYSRPHRAGRKLFGGLVQYGQPWRLGANEATEIEFFQPVTIQGRRVPAGRYVLYAVPEEKKWTLVLNKNLYSWGLKFNPADDAARFDVPVQAAPQPVEYFTMSFAPTAGGAELIMAWENTEARLPLQF